MLTFATVDENGFPQIRIIDVMIVENEKLYFCTARGKDFYHQIITNGQVCHYRNEQRVSNGEAKWKGEKT